jgi:hypothetical protein
VEDSKFIPITFTLPPEMARELDIYCAILRARGTKPWSRSALIRSIIQDLLISNKEDIENYSTRVLQRIEAQSS